LPNLTYFIFESRIFDQYIKQLLLDIGDMAKKTPENLLSCVPTADTVLKEQDRISPSGKEVFTSLIDEIYLKGQE